MELEPHPAETERHEVSGSRSLAESDHGVFDGAVLLFRTSFKRVWALSLAGSLAPFLSIHLVYPVAASLAPASTEAAAIASAAVGVMIFSYCYLAVVARMDAGAHARALGYRQTLACVLARCPAFLSLATAGLLVYSTPIVAAASAMLYMLGLYAMGLGAVLMSIFEGAAALSGGAGADVDPEPVLDAMVATHRRVVLLFALAGVTGVLSIALTVYGYFAGLVIVTERLGPVAALRRSFGLVRRNWWRTTGILTVACIACAVASGHAIGAVSDAHEAMVWTVATVLFSVGMTFLAAVSLATLYDLDRRRRSRVTAPPPQEGTAFPPETPG